MGFAALYPSYEDATSRSRGIICPSLSINLVALSKRAQGMPGAGWHPRSRVQCAQTSARTSIQVQPEERGALRSLPVIASVANQSILRLAERWIASSLRSLAQTLRVCRRQ